MTEHREGRVSTRCTVRPCNCTLHNSTLCDVCVFGPARNYEMTYSNHQLYARLPLGVASLKMLTRISKIHNNGDDVVPGTTWPGTARRGRL